MNLHSLNNKKEDKHILMFQYSVTIVIKQLVELIRDMDTSPLVGPIRDMYTSLLVGPIRDMDTSLLVGPI